jgi:arsenite methyltransferase
VEAAIDSSGVGPGQVAADIGFGGGIGLELLLDRVGASGHVHGVDISTTMVASARRTFADAVSSGALSIEEGSLTSLPVPDDSVDGIVTVNTLYFVEDLETAVRELARILRPRGRLVIAIGDPESMARMPVTAHGFRLRPPEDILGVMAWAGLADTNAEPFRAGARKGHLLIGTRDG